MKERYLSSNDKTHYRQNSNSPAGHFYRHAHWQQDINVLISLSPINSKASIIRVISLKDASADGNNQHAMMERTVARIKPISKQDAAVNNDLNYREL